MKIEELFTLTVEELSDEGIVGSYEKDFDHYPTKEEIAEGMAEIKAMRGFYVRARVEKYFYEVVEDGE